MAALLKAILEICKKVLRWGVGLLFAIFHVPLPHRPAANEDPSITSCPPQLDSSLHEGPSLSHAFRQVAPPPGEEQSEPQMAPQLQQPVPN